MSTAIYLFLLGLARSSGPDPSGPNWSVLLVLVFRRFNHLSRESRFGRHTALGVPEPASTNVNSDVLAFFNLLVWPTRRLGFRKGVVEASSPSPFGCTVFHFRTCRSWKVRRTLEEHQNSDLSRYLFLLRSTMHTKRHIGELLHTSPHSNIKCLIFPHAL